MNLYIEGGSRSPASSGMKIPVLGEIHRKLRRVYTQPIAGTPNAIAVIPGLIGDQGLLKAKKRERSNIKLCNKLSSYFILFEETVRREQGNKQSRLSIKKKTIQMKMDT